MGNMTKQYRIQIFAPEQQVLVRSVLKGILEFCLSENQWQVGRMDPRYKGSLHEADIDGIIGFFPQKKDLEGLPSVPTVNISGSMPDPPLHTVVPNSIEIGRLAARHLLEQGYRNFAYTGTGGALYSLQRGEGFQHELNRLGFGEKILGLHRLRDVRPALKKTELPLGMFCATDSRAGDVARICQDQGLSVPQDVGLVGCDNDELGYLRAGVPLTSVHPNGEAVGWAAAKVLKDLLSGRRRKRMVTMPPLGLIARQSTDLMKTRDPLVAQILRCLREQALSGQTITQIIQPIPACRSAIESRFKQAVGRTLLQELKRIRLEEACRLLLESRMQVAEIMETCGYTCPKQFHREFKTQTRMTPRQYRNGMTGGRAQGKDRF